MNFKKINIKNEYRSNVDDVVKDFYVPLLSNAVSYKRSVAYFSSSALIAISQGIKCFLKNGGQIQLIASPELSENDIENIKLGYELREIVKDNLEKSLSLVSSKGDLEKLNILSHLIENSVLDIKIAFYGKYGLYHDKVGIIEDKYGNTLTFSGSMNETWSAFKSNYETFDVFKSWDADKHRVDAKISTFDNTWNDLEEGITVLPFTNELIPLLKKYKKNTVMYDIDDENYGDMHFEENYVSKKYPKLPPDLKLREYQLEAIDKWVESDCRGILSMATGTGKTLTALGAIVKLYQKLDEQLSIIIVCPYQHLVEQWAEDVKWFNMEPIMGYSASQQKSWKKYLYSKANSYENKIINHFCFITTNATFISKDVQKILSTIKNNCLLVADEAHNFGAKYISKHLPENINFRLALSATIERHRDLEGTKSIFDYFGNVCYEYTLARAISDDKLVNYYYYPVVTYLSAEELEQYNEISLKISRLMSYNYEDKEGLIELLLIKRSRIVAGAENKIIELEKIMRKLENESHILVYCGTAKHIIWHEEEDKYYDKEIRQLDSVTDLIGNKLDRRVKKYTSEENRAERALIKKQFKDKSFDVLVAIKCLDEGVDIPEIKTAIILASSTNPKEYIQRRGRVLRKNKNKDFAYIYDLVTLPYPLKTASMIKNHDNQILSLVERELIRVEEFGNISLNSRDSDKLRHEVKSAFSTLVIKE